MSINKNIDKIIEEYFQATKMISRAHAKEPPKPNLDLYIPPAPALDDKDIQKKLKNSQYYRGPTIHNRGY